MPGERPRKMVGGEGGGAVAGVVLPHRLHPATRTLCSDSAEQATALRSALPNQRSDTAGTRPRPEASGSRDRIPWRAPYLGTEPSAEPSLRMPVIIISFIFNE